MAEIQRNITKQTKGMAAVYLVAAELSKKGCIVTTTARNAPSVDIIVASGNMKKAYNIQVKASTQSYFLLRKEAKKMKSPFYLYVFVKSDDDFKNPIFYVVKSSKVAEKTKLYRSKGANWYYYEPTINDQNNWDIIK